MNEKNSVCMCGFYKKNIEDNFDWEGLWMKRKLDIYIGLI